MNTHYQAIAVEQLDLIEELAVARVRHQKTKDRNLILVTTLFYNYVLRPLQFKLLNEQLQFLQNALAKLTQKNEEASHVSSQLCINESFYSSSTSMWDQFLESYRALEDLSVPVETLRMYSCHMCAAFHEVLASYPKVVDENLLRNQRLYKAYIAEMLQTLNNSGGEARFSLEPVNENYQRFIDEQCGYYQHQVRYFAVKPIIFSLVMLIGACISLGLAESGYKKPLAFTLIGLSIAVECWALFQMGYYQHRYNEYSAAQRYVNHSNFFRSRELGIIGENSTASLTETLTVDVAVDEENELRLVPSLSTSSLMY